MTTRAVLAVVMASGLALAGCRAVGPSSPPISPDLEVGALAHRTDFELGRSQTRWLEGDPDREVGPAEVGPESVGDSLVVTTTDQPVDTDPIDDTDQDQRRRNGLFYGGLAVLAVGAVATVGLMTAGQVLETRLDDGYAGSMSREREQRLRDRGRLTNQLAIGTGGVSLLGLALLLTGYGLDYSVCGKLSRRTKKCRGRR